MGEAWPVERREGGLNAYRLPALPCAMRVITDGAQEFDVRVVAKHAGGLEMAYEGVWMRMHVSGLGFGAVGLPASWRAERDRLLAQADGKIRDGLVALAERFGQLKQAQGWDRIGTRSAPGRIGIWLSHAERGKGGGRGPVAEADRVGLLVVIQAPTNEPTQLAMGPIYAELGLIGQVNRGGRGMRRWRRRCMSWWMRR